MAAYGAGPAHAASGSHPSSLSSSGEDDPKMNAPEKPAEKWKGDHAFYKPEHGQNAK